jgi:alanyl-tRNA synthetase
MKYMSHNEIRNNWFKYFTEHGHKVIPSAPLVPIDDDSLLWINAGVTPLKKYFDGRVVPDSRRLCSIQKCIRTNDIENVGVTKRHLTFFEMMGNFSVGDYFREEAIGFAWELLTSKDWFNIDKSLLYVTIYPDDEATYKRWIEVGMMEDHIVKIPGNFWEIGNGPCGPDTEIFFDRGAKYGDDSALDKFKKDEEQERYVEIWNNVFSQFNAEEGVERSKYRELPSKNIDTGAGLERWCTIFQDVDSIYDTDLFTSIISHISELANTKYNGQKEIKVIADHIRTITFALADGACFENVGRGYVLRRLLRRSVRMGRNIGIKAPFMYKLVSDVCDIMGDAYPYLLDKRGYVEALVLEEEKLFLKTLEAGERRLKDLIDNSNDKVISGEEAFKLYDTYGFPFELTEEYLKEKGFSVSRDEFNKYMEIQKDLARKSAKNKSAMAKQKKILLDFKDKSEFVYSIYRLRSNVIAIFSKDSLVESSNHDTYIALQRTCFYAESGGQVSDTGMIVGKNFKARVISVFKGPNGQNIHQVRLLDGVISVGDECEEVVDREERRRTECNHSSVHILQYSLQQVVDKTIKQAGSYVDADKLRFDFTYSGKMSEDKILAVEKFANDMIKEDLIVSTEIMPLDKAKKLGAMALFSEKYGDVVRVVKIGKSIELCGGTHATNTKDISNLAIISCESKGSNIWRIEATTGKKCELALYDAIKPYNDEMMKLLMKAKEIVNEAHSNGILLNFDVNIDNSKPTSYNDIIKNRNELAYVQDEVKTLEKTYFEKKTEKVLSNLEIYKNNSKDYKGITGIIMSVKNMDNNLLKMIADALVNDTTKGFVFFANIKSDETVNFIARSNTNINAGLVVKATSVMTNGNGGGSATFAQGGGKTTKNMEEVLTYVKETLEKHE